ncbi:tryptophan-rich sensory protein [Maribacter cobaltidurans]|uniref:Uncharacterized protein n=1 Tax=Maribacter cobaltidurans TaxID=1178778 RepID=A0A223V5F1_9FLAO|nr:tryptophan-rich sensory protein [Maribacter cobaltidurans]ASV30644.1 hypothetical protein CJ263_10705 [Maribacter cobaltidurans]GGD80545.1 membrane protein [Maribacter cobaltidurans]
MKEARAILTNILIRWRLIRALEILLMSLSFAAIAYLLFFKMWVAIAFFLGVLLVGAWYVGLWRFSLENICSHVDRTIPPMEHSTALLLESENQLSVLAQIQQSKVSRILQKHKREIHFKNYLWPFLGLAVICFISAWWLMGTGILLSKDQKSGIPKDDVVHFQVLDSVSEKIVPPNMVTQDIRIRYPDYTQESVKYTSNMNLKVLEGAQITWNLEFDQPLQYALLQMGEDSLAMNMDTGRYSKRMIADRSNFYSIKFVDTLGHGYLSDLFALETYPDESPKIEIQGLPQFSSFDFKGPQQLKFSAGISDDFGISDVAIVATVSKGSGESVKFREERLGFDSKFTSGTKQQDLSKSLNLKDLRMEPGDELYFYVEAIDNKRPKANMARTETFFAVIKDTVINQFAVEGTLGADLMPDYFRSQRQLIIDTEKLIADQPSIEKREFNSRSNELGFDQKALRIKYGEFMGDETEGPVASEVQQESHDENPLAEYTHDHDGANEHNLVAEEHEDHSDEEGEEDPLEAYVHNHEDPEASTLFAQSLRSKLKQAMAEMWDAELYLRLFQPEKSLPYQYKALKLIQEIKNSARIYVHRIGFDPPPIKEDKRLTGELKEIGNYSKNEALEKEELFANMQKAVTRLEMLLESTGTISRQDRQLFDRAGNELARLAIEEPGKYLETLQSVKLLSQSERVSRQQLQKVLKGLYGALPQKQTSPRAEQRYTNQLNHLFIEALDVE